MAEHPSVEFTSRMMSNLDGEKDQTIAELVKALESARDAVEYSVEVHGTDHGGMMLSALNQIDRMLGRVKSPGGADHG